MEIDLISFLLCSDFNEIEQLYNFIVRDDNAKWDYFLPGAYFE
jgi:hypothetical protein